MGQNAHAEHTCVQVELSAARSEAEVATEAKNSAESALEDVQVFLVCRGCNLRWDYNTSHIECNFNSMHYIFNVISI